MRQPYKRKPGTENQTDRISKSGELRIFENETAGATLKGGNSRKGERDFKGLISDEGRRVRSGE